jgi:hypothetical protein
MWGGDVDINVHITGHLMMMVNRWRIEILVLKMWRRDLKVGSRIQRQGRVTLVNELQSLRNVL